MRNNLELAFSAAQLTGYLNGLLLAGAIPAIHRATLADLVGKVRRANGMEDEPQGCVATVIPFPSCAPGA